MEWKIKKMGNLGRKRKKRTYRIPNTIDSIINNIFYIIICSNNSNNDLRGEDNE